MEEGDHSAERFLGYNVANLQASIHSRGAPFKNGERRTAHALFFVRSRYNQHFPARVTFAFFDAVWYWIADDFTTLL